MPRVSRRAKHLFICLNIIYGACFPLIMDFVISNANFTLAVIFTMFVLALLGLVTSSLIIYQMVNTPNWPNTPLYVPVMFIDHPPAYQQLDNLLE